jgi:hypothetical protein
LWRVTVDGADKPVDQLAGSAQPTPLDVTQGSGVGARIEERQPRRLATPIVVSSFTHLVLLNHAHAHAPATSPARRYRIGRLRERSHEAGGLTGDE